MKPLLNHPPIPSSRPLLSILKHLGGSNKSSNSSPPPKKDGVTFFNEKIINTPSLPAKQVESYFIQPPGSFFQWPKLGRLSWFTNNTQPPNKHHQDTNPVNVSSPITKPIVQIQPTKETEPTLLQQAFLWLLSFRDTNQKSVTTTTTPPEPQSQTQINQDLPPQGPQSQTQKNQHLPQSPGSSNTKPNLKQIPIGGKPKKEEIESQGFNFNMLLKKFLSLTSPPQVVTTVVTTEKQETPIHQDTSSTKPQKAPHPHVIMGFGETEPRFINPNNLPIPLFEQGKIEKENVSFFNMKTLVVETVPTRKLRELSELYGNVDRLVKSGKVQNVGLIVLKSNSFSVFKNTSTCEHYLVKSRFDDNEKMKLEHLNFQLDLAVKIACSDTELVFSPHQKKIMTEQIKTLKDKIKTFKENLKNNNRDLKDKPDPNKLFKQQIEDNFAILQYIEQILKSLNFLQSKIIYSSLEDQGSAKEIATKNKVKIKDLNSFLKELQHLFPSASSSLRSSNTKSRARSTSPSVRTPSSNRSNSSERSSRSNSPAKRTRSISPSSSGSRSSEASSPENTRQKAANPISHFPKLQVGSSPKEL